MRYRPDVDGLRALAVSAVVLFHADIRPFGSGSLGVDIFFVISGFLITTLIIDETEAGTFSLVSFYERRVRRIIPAAALMLAASSLIAWLVLLPNPLTAFCKSLLAAVFFSSNWYFLSDVSYFAAPAATKPLLHTWTLSIEEQFYLVFPFVMLFLTTTARRFCVLALLCGGSILFARWLSIAANFDAIFFNSFARAFEPLIGCLTAIVYRSVPAGPVLSGFARVAGLGIMGYAIFIAPLPSGYKQLLVPCLGAAAFLFARPSSRDPVFRVMGSAPFRTVGKMSYSIYLWHWPVLVFARIYLGVLDGVATAACILLTLVLSAATLYAVENPVRFRRAPRSRPAMFALAGAATAVIAIFAGSGIYTNGMPSRVPKEVAAVNEATTFDPVIYRCFDPPGGPAGSLALAEADQLCHIGNSSRPRIDFILWGDSHSFIAAHALSELAQEFGLSGLLAMVPGCPSLINTVNRDTGKTQKCVEFYQSVARLVDRHDIRLIFMVNRWSLYTEGELLAGSEGYLKFANDWDRQTDPHDVFAVSLERTIAEFPGRQIVFLKEPPVQRFLVTDTMAANAMMGLPASRLESRWTTRQEHLDRYAFLTRTFDAARSKFDNIAVLDPIPILCNGNHCSASKDGLPLYWDDDHLNSRGARLLKPLFEPFFRQLKASAAE